MIKSKVIAFDLDDVLCYRPSHINLLGPEKYLSCLPIQSNIDLVNNLYLRGFVIIIYTARGMTFFNGDVSRIYSELYNLTFNQLTHWSIKFTQLVMGKIHYDLFIDDKAMNSKFFNLDFFDKHFSE